MEALVQVDEHLAHLLGRSHVAVLRYDRRKSADGQDVPLPVQASDALAAVRCLREVVGPVQTGLWGFSQGAWAAPLAAVTAPDSVDFLICVSCFGVSPAERMQVGCSRQLRKHGFSDSEVGELTRTRLGGNPMSGCRSRRALSPGRQPRSTAR